MVQGRGHRLWRGLPALSCRIPGGFRDGLLGFHEFPEMVEAEFCEYTLFPLGGVSLAYIRLSTGSISPQGCKCYPAMERQGALEEECMRVVGKHQVEQGSSQNRKAYEKVLSSGL